MVTNTRCDECSTRLATVCGTWCDGCYDRLLHPIGYSDDGLGPARPARPVPEAEGGPFRLEAWAASDGDRWGQP